MTAIMVRNGALVSRLRERHPLLELNVQIRRTSNHEMREALFRVHGIEVNAVVETNNDLLLRSLIADGVGMGMVREDFAAIGERDGVFGVAPIGRAGTHLQFVYPDARTTDPVIRAVLSIVRTLWPEAALMESRGC